MMNTEGSPEWSEILSWQLIECWTILKVLKSQWLFWKYHPDSEHNPDSSLKAKTEYLQYIMQSLLVYIYTLYTNTQQY